MKQCANVTAACRVVGVSRDFVYGLRARDPQFARQWDDAVAEGIDLLELAAYARAKNGTKRPIYMKGKDGTPQKVGEVIEHSDRLAEFLLSGYKPHLFRKNVSAEISGPGGLPLAPAAPVQVILSIPDNHRGDTQPGSVVEMPPAQPALPPVPQPAQAQQPAPQQPAQPAQAEAEPEPTAKPMTWAELERERQQREFDDLERQNAEAKKRIAAHEELRRIANRFGGFNPGTTNTL